MKLKDLDHKLLNKLKFNKLMINVLRKLDKNYKKKLNGF